MDETLQPTVQVSMPPEVVKELTMLASPYGIERSALIVSRLRRDGGDQSFGRRLEAIEQAMWQVLTLLEVLVGDAQKSGHPLREDRSGYTVR